MGYRELLAARQHMVPRLAGGGILDSGINIPWLQTRKGGGGTAGTGGGGDPSNADPAWKQWDGSHGMGSTKDLLNWLATMDPTTKNNAIPYTATQPTLAVQPNFDPNAGQIDYNDAVGRISNTYNNQSHLAQALINQSKGIGPNPAQQQYQQNIDQLAKQQAGAIASQRGINPGLAARLIGQQTAATQQGATANAAVLQAQQQLASQQQLAQLLNQQRETAASGGSLANQMYGHTLEGIGDYNRASLAAQIAPQEINARIAAARLGAKNQMTGSILGALGSVGGGLAAGWAGKSGGDDGSGGGGGSMGESEASSAGNFGSGAEYANYAFSGGEIDHQAMSLAQALRAKGGAVPGQAKVSGDSPKNDTVPTVLSPKEIVLPRSVTMAPDAPARAKAFVEQLKAKAHPTYGRVLQARKKLKDAMAAHKMAGGLCA